MNPPVAILTGAGGGIGQAIARRLAQAGFDLVLGDVRREPLTACAEIVRAQGRGAVCVPGDVGDLDTHQRLLDAALDRFGRCDGLVNNAGVSVASAGSPLEVTPQSYDLCLSVNARAVFFLTQRLARHFADTPPDGAARFVVTITSSNAAALSPSRSEYCVSKAAASMATQCFAAALAPHGVSVFELRPGVIETPMTAARLDDYRRRMTDENLIAMPRLGRPEDVAACVATLVGGGLPYTVGQIVAVDGGLASRRY